MSSHCIPVQEIFIIYFLKSMKKDVVEKFTKSLIPDLTCANLFTF